VKAQFLRCKIPVLVAENTVVWVVGFRLDEKVKITNKTKNTLYLSWEKNE
jgi:hypothetical protein